MLPRWGLISPRFSFFPLPPLKIRLLGYFTQDKGGGQEDAGLRRQRFYWGLSGFFGCRRRTCEWMSSETPKSSDSSWGSFFPAVFLFCWLGRDALPLCVLDAREKLRFAMRDLGKIFDWGLGERNNPPECSRLLLTSRNRKRISRRVRLSSSILIVLFCRAEQRGSLSPPLMNASVGPQNKKG